MLVSLNIRNVVLIDSLDIDFSSGFCALTGETGAGKSILLDSMGLALGSRAEARLVRKGAAEASVSAVFELQNSTHPSYDILRSTGVDTDGDEIILRRSLTADGRSKAFINDQPVSVGLLKQVGDALVEIHGQFDTRGLLDPSTHRGMLDEYMMQQTGQELSALTKYFELWNAYKEDLVELQKSSDQARTEEEFLRTSLEDLDNLDAQANEEQGLSELRERLMHRERVLEGLNTAYHALNDDTDPVQSALGALDRVADKMGADITPVLETLERAYAEVQEAVSLIQSLSSDLQESEHNLGTIDERLHLLRAQARKHDCDVADLPVMREQLAARLNRIEHADDLLSEQMQKVEKARRDYVAEAEKVSKSRSQAGQKLDGLVQKELPPLKLDKAKFITEISRLEEDKWSSHGLDCVRFLVQTNPGSEPGPLNKIASGGEMSRFMLALKVVMAEVGSAGTLVFDEVDAGIGGSTADAVGERLAKLSEKRQVLVVTHAPQVAARARSHMIVRKGGAKDVRTDVIALNDNDERREEIARMLAGATITEEARAAADKLLETGT